MADPVTQKCLCDCFECRILKRHDICRHLLKCIKRPLRELVNDDE